MFAVSEIVTDAAVAGGLGGVVLAVSKWARARLRFVVAAVSAFIGFVAWNLVLDATHARGFNTDAPVVRVSWADAGSSVLAFTVAVLVLGFTNRREPASRVLTAAIIVGLAALLVDIYVL